MINDLLSSFNGSQVAGRGLDRKMEAFEQELGHRDAQQQQLKDGLQKLAQELQEKAVSHVERGDNSCISRRLHCV